MILNGAARRDIMENFVSRTGQCARQTSQVGSLYSSAGERKYLNAEERRSSLAIAAGLPRDQELFVLTLAWTGARVSEVLALFPASFQIEASVVSIRTLKRRRFVMREVPIPPWLMASLDEHYGLRRLPRDPEAAHRPLWPWCRQTAWRIVKDLARATGVNGRRASPRGFRHGFGVGATIAGVPLNLVQRFLGHASIASTAIYADASGPEEIAFASRFWSAGSQTDQSGGLLGQA